MSSVRTLAFMDNSHMSARQRLALTKGTVAPLTAMALPDADINIEFIKSNRVCISNLRTARLSPLDLKVRGCESAMELRALGFDALDLVDAGFCSASVSAFGADAVRSAFCLEAGDAVVLAGSPAVFQLNLNTQRLLKTCAACPSQAKAVLQQTEPRAGALHGVSASVVLDAGLRAETLCSLGYSMHLIREQTSASDREMSKLGF